MYLESQIGHRSHDAVFLEKTTLGHLMEPFTTFLETAATW